MYQFSSAAILTYLKIYNGGFNLFISYLFPQLGPGRVQASSSSQKYAFIYLLSCSFLTDNVASLKTDWTNIGLYLYFTLLTI